MAKEPKLQIDNTANDRENFLFNQKVIIEEFDDLIKEYNRAPNEHFLHALFSMVRTQDTFVAHLIKNGHRFADTKAEKTIFNKWCKTLKNIFGNTKFDEMYIKWRNRCDED